MPAKKGNTAEARRNGGIEIIIEQDDPLEDHFKSLPNALLRGEVDEKYGFDFRGYTLRERALLAALVSNTQRYRCTRNRIEALAPELGPDGLDTVINGLKSKGHIRTTRVNDPDNQGKFVWQWQVSLRPMPAAAVVDPAGESPAPSMGGLDPHGGTAGQTMGGSATDGSAMDGQDGSKYLKDQVLKEPISLSPRADSGQGKRERPTPPTKPPPPRPAVDVEALVDAALTRFPTWSRSETRRVLKAELADGRPPEVVARAWPLFLADPQTKSPNRFKHPQAWWTTAYGPAAARPPRQRCGCVNGRVAVPNPDNLSADLWQPCPSCQPTAASAA